MENDRHSKIRQRAYEIWDREGRQNGRADEHWLQAEREVAAQAAAQAAPAAETAAAPANKKAPVKKTSNGATKPPAASLRSGQRTRRGSQPVGQN